LSFSLTGAGEAAVVPGAGGCELRLMDQNGNIDILKK
jgi:hypothetical protein